MERGTSVQNTGEKFVWKRVKWKRYGGILNRKAFEIDCQRNSFANTPTTRTN